MVIIEFDRSEFQIYASVSLTHINMLVQLTYKNSKYAYALWWMKSYHWAFSAHGKWSYCWRNLCFSSISKCKSSWSLWKNNCNETQSSCWTQWLSSKSSVNKEGTEMGNLQWTIWVCLNMHCTLLNTELFNFLHNEYMWICATASTETYSSIEYFLFKW